ACRCRRRGRSSASVPLARQVASTKGRELAPRRHAISNGGEGAGSAFISASMTRKIPTATIIRVMPRSRPARSIIGIRQPFDQELREGRETGDVLLVRAFRVAAVREGRDDDPAAV